MTLDLFDTEVGDPLAARVHGVDYDYQAEQWVIDTHGDRASTVPGRWVVRWELVDALGVRARWERADGDPSMPRLAFASDRFTGVRP